MSSTDRTLSKINIFTNLTALENHTETEIGDTELSIVGEIAVVVETYRNGSSWYRVWSDGWIEQGGIIDSLADIWTITFLKQFTTSTYTLQGEEWGTDTTGNLGITSQTPTAASGNHIGASVIKVSWYACGY